MTEPSLTSLEERIKACERRAATLADEVQRVAKEAARAREDAHKALTKADGASHELRSIGEGLVRHVGSAVQPLVDIAKDRNERLGIIEHRLGEQDGGLKTLLDESRKFRARQEAKSSLKLEDEANAAFAHLRSERKRKLLSWTLGILFVCAQLAQLLRSLFWN